MIRPGDVRGFRSVIQNTSVVTIPPDQRFSGGGGIGGGVNAPDNTGVLFHADWSSLTGASINALTDYLKSQPFDKTEYARTSGGGSIANVLNVVSAVGIGFPLGMTNVLEVTRSTDDDYAYLGIGVTGGAKWPALAIGASQFHRLYMKDTAPDGQANTSASSHHPIVQAYAAGHSFEIEWYWNDNGTFSFRIINSAGGLNGFPKDHSMLGSVYLGSAPGQTTRTGATLPKQTVLRWEWMVRRDTASGYSFAVRIYDATNEASGGGGVLMWAEDDGLGQSLGTVYEESGGGSPGVNPKRMAQNNGLYAVEDNADFQTFGLGPNGNSQGYSPSVKHYYGGVVIRNDRWCGKYNGGI